MAQQYRRGKSRATGSLRKSYRRLNVVDLDKQTDFGLDITATSEEDSGFKISDLCKVRSDAMLNKSEHKMHDGIFVQKAPSAAALRWLEEWKPKALGIYLGQVRIPSDNRSRTATKLMFYQKFMFDGLIIYMLVDVAREVIEVIK